MFAADAIEKVRNIEQVAECQRQRLNCVNDYLGGETKQDEKQATEILQRTLATGVSGILEAEDGEVFPIKLDNRTKSIVVSELKKLKDNRSQRITPLAQKLFARFDCDNLAKFSLKVRFFARPQFP